MTLLNFPSPFGASASGAAAKPLPIPAHAGDWGQQELADLYRVEALLVQANMRVETERGTTDEGEPWFVFCRPDGDVFVHLCRIDGAYLLDSPGLDAPLRGSDFAQLIDQFIKGVAARAATSNVVQLRRARHDSVVRLHPAIMMAALIWSLYLASDDLMEAAHAAELNLEAGDAGTLFGLKVGEDAEGLVAELDAMLAVNDNEGRSVPGLREGEAGRGLSEGRGILNGAAAASLAATMTAIAVTYGLIEQRHIEAEISRLVDAGADSTKDEGAGHTDLVLAEVSDYGGAPLLMLVREQTPVALDGSPAPGLSDLLADTIAAALTKLANADVAPALASMMERASSTELLAEVPHMHERTSPPTTTLAAAPIVTKASSGVDTVGDRTSAEIKTLAVAEDKPVGTLGSVYQRDEVIVTASLDRDAFVSTATINRDAFLSRESPALQNTAKDLVVAVVVEEVETAKSLLLSQLNSLLPSLPSQDNDDLVESPSGSRNPLWTEFNTAAYEQIESFVEKLDTVKLQRRGETILIADMTAFDGSGDDQYETRSWTAGNNLVVTVGGHAQDLLDFGLIFA